MQEKRSDEILRRAAELIELDGYDGMGMRRLADAVSIQPASLYYHFRDKEAILYEIAVKSSVEFIRVLNTVMDRELSPSDAVRALAQTYVIHYWENKTFITSSSREMRHLSAEHKLEIQQQRRGFQQNFQDLIERGIESGEFRVKYPRIAAIALLDMFNGVAQWFDPTAGNIEDMASKYADFAIAFLGGEAPRE